MKIKEINNFIYSYIICMGFPGDLAVKNTHSNWEEIDLIPGSGRYLGERNGNAPQYSYLRNSMDKGAWWATVHEVARVGHHLATKQASLVAQRLKRLPSMWETWVQPLGQEDPLEKEMATQSSILTWRIPWTEEPDGPQSTDCRVGHDWTTSLSLSLATRQQQQHRLVY